LGAWAGGRESSIEWIKFEQIGAHTLGFSLEGSKALILSMNSGLMQHWQQNGSSTAKMTTEKKMHHKAPPTSVMVVKPCEEDSY